MNTIETIEAPHDALTNVVESLVISFELLRERRRFTLVCDYPLKPSGAHRSFIGLVFDGVRDFTREEGGIPGLGRFHERFQARSLTMPIVIEEITSTSMANGWHLSLWLGYGFGGLQFVYDTARAYQRNAVAKEMSGEWLYRDMHSQEEYDFYDPFPDLMNW